MQKRYSNSEIKGFYKKLGVDQGGFVKPYSLSDGGEIDSDSWIASDSNTNLKCQTGEKF